MNKVLKTLLLGVSLTVSVNTAIAMNQYVKPENVAQKETELMTAAWSGNLNELEEAMQKYPDQIGKQTKGGVTALMYAAKNGHLDCVKVLMNTIEARMQDESGWTAMMMAATEGFEACVAALMNKEVGLVNEYGGTALMCAACHGHADCVKDLMNKEAGLQDQYGWTALMLAVDRNHIDCANILVKTAEAKKVNNDGNTALRIAADHGDVFCVKTLVDEEAGLINKDGWTALMYAAGHGHADCVSVLMGREAGLINKDGWTALMCAACHGHVECVKLLSLKEKGLANKYGDFAFMTSNDPQIRVLLKDELKAAINGVEGVTPLMAAAANGEDVKPYLNGAGQRTTTKKFTALMLASMMGNEKAVKLLLDSEACLQDANRKTAMMWAAWNGWADCVAALKDKETGNQDKDGMTALMWAVSYGCADCVYELKDAEAKILINKRSALDRAEYELERLIAQPPATQDKVAIANYQKIVEILEDVAKAAAPNLGKLTEAQFKQEWTDYMQQRAQTSATDISWIKDQGKTDLLRELAYQTATKKPYDDVFYQDHEKEQYLFIVVRTIIEKAVQENNSMTAENAFIEVGKYLEGIRIIGDVRKPLVEKIQQEIAANGAKEQIIADAKEYIEHTDVLEFCQNQQKKSLGK